MGTRVLRVSPEFLIEFLKEPGDRTRSYTVSGALPDDAALELVSGSELEGDVLLIVRSESWDGYDIEMRAPVVAVHVGGES